MAVNRKKHGKSERQGMTFNLDEDLRKKINRLSRSKNNNKSLIARKAFEEFLSKPENYGEVYVPVEQREWPLGAVTSVLGGSVKAIDAFSRLVAWIDGTRHADIPLLEGGELFYNNLFDKLKSLGRLEEIISQSWSNISWLGFVYYKEKSAHYTLYELAEKRLRNDHISKTEREFLILRINQYINLEYDKVANLCSASDQLRFDTLVSHRFGLLNKRLDVPDWAKIARNALIAMNQEWIEDPKEHEAFKAEFGPK